MGHRLSHNTSLKVQTQGTTAKKPCTEEFRPKEAKSADGKALTPPRFDQPVKPNRKKKKRKWLKMKKDSTLAIGDNAIEAQKRKQTPGNISQVTCYNCQKKGHFANKYPEAPKN